MKKSITTASPFLMLLIPVFFCIGMLLIGDQAEVPASKVSANSLFQLPGLKVMIKAIL